MYACTVYVCVYIFYAYVVHSMYYVCICVQIIMEYSVDFKGFKRYYGDKEKATQYSARWLGT